MAVNSVEPTPEQRAAIQVHDRALVVEAGAGTGKTWVLVQRFLHLLAAHPEWPLESIVAVTFTKKATREMRSRIRAAIEEEARLTPAGSHWRARRQELERLQVDTIHGLCARILRENAISAGVDPVFGVLDQQEAELLKEEAIRRTLAALVEADDPALALLADLHVHDLRGEMAALLAQRGTVGRLFETLPDEEALLSEWQKGIGQMRRLMWDDLLAADPNLSAALAAVPATPVINAQDKLAPMVEAAQAGCRLLVEEEDWPGAVACWSPIKINVGGRDNWGGADGLAELKGWLRSLREAARVLEGAGAAGDIGPDDREAAAALRLWHRLWQKLIDCYDRLKEETGVLDFDDLERLAEKLLRAEERSGRLVDYLAGVNHLMVDEFQDTNEIQGQIVYALAHPEDGGRLFVVGDAKQSIYRFRQAQVSVFNQTAADVEQATGLGALPLSLSFRSHSALVGPLNHLFQRIFRPLGRAYEIYEARPGPLEAHRPAPESQPVAPAPVELVLLPRVDAAGESVYAEDGRIWEARLLAQRLRELKQGEFQVWDREQGRYRSFQYGDAAILFRATTPLPLYEEQFKGAGLPYLTISGRGYFDRPEVRDLIALLACLYNPGDDLSLATVLRSPLFSLSDETLYRLRWHDGRGMLLERPVPFRQALQNRPPGDQAEEMAFAAQVMEELWSLAGRVDIWRLLRTAVDRTGYEAALASAQAESGGRGVANLHKFLDLARERGGASLSEFARRLRDLQAREAREGEGLDAPPEQGAVQLMSIHAAKGLEFPVVAVADMGRRPFSGGGSPRILHDPAFGLVCKRRDENGDWVEPAGYGWAKWLDGRMEAAESKRLLYVACTRAADLLLLSGKSGESSSWLNQVLQAWEIETAGEPESFWEEAGFRLRIIRPAVRPDDRKAEPTPRTPETTLPGIPPLAWPLDRTLPAPPIAVTRLVERLAQEAGELPMILPVVSRPEPGTGALRPPRWLVGQVVHRALADWTCLALPRAELESKLMFFARREGAIGYQEEPAVGLALGMLERLKRHPLYKRIDGARERHVEVPFTLETSLRPLHGKIDLLYRDEPDGWHLVDWKSEWLERGRLEEQVGEHLLQMAVYAAAVRQVTGVEPQATLCFLAPRVILHTFGTDELAAALEAMTGA